MELMLSDDDARPTSRGCQEHVAFVCGQRIRAPSFITNLI